MTRSVLTPTAPFWGLLPVSAAGHGVIAIDRDGLGLATILVSKNRLGALSQRIGELFGVELPQSSRRVSAGDVAFASVGPEAWLATRESGGNAFTASLQDEIGSLASVSDQSDAYAVLRLTGPKVLETLAKMIPIDVHPRAFTPGDVASTVAAHIGITLWRLADSSDGTPLFEVAVFRSLAVSFWHALCTSAGEFGVTVAHDEPLTSLNAI
jgi:heterotetrameric sarcosine oxidase gamma subunit